MNNNAANGLLTAGKNLSCWYDDAMNMQIYPALKENIETEVVVVGGGLAGLSVAYNLTLAGINVAVVEDGWIGSGETGRTTAQLVTALDDRYYEMEENIGREKTKLIAESHKAAINYVEQTVKKENIDCDFERVNGYLFLHPSDDKDSLQKELAAATRAGIDIKAMHDMPGISQEGNCLCFGGQAQFHPLKYLMGLCRAITENGGMIYTKTHASKIDHTGIVSKEGFSIKAKQIVVATNAPVNDKYNMMLKQWPFRTYVIAALVKKDTLPKAFWWDTGDQTVKSCAPYHYVRLHAYNDENDLLIVGGEDHNVGHTNADGEQEEDRYALLEAWARKRFDIGEVVSQWSGEVLVPMDAIAYIGRDPFSRHNVFIITGDCGIGMTHCTIAGILITDLIMGRENKWEDLYAPHRFTIKTSKPFFKMLANDLVLVLKKWFYTDTSQLSDIQTGEAKIIKVGGRKCGAYRDEYQQLHIVSAECTHLKCMLCWNKGELSWDCPCHGSRFSYDGTVINGPANKDLSTYGENKFLRQDDISEI